jgi:hypothetical protein
MYMNDFPTLYRYIWLSYPSGHRDRFTALFTRFRKTSPLRHITQLRRTGSE